MGERKPNGYWKDIENVKKEIIFIKEKHGLKSIPTQNKLKKLGYGDMISGIKKYHKSINKIRKLFGEKLLKKPNGYWKDIENVKKEISLIKKIYKTNTLPSSSFLNKNGYYYLGYAIYKYHGGFSYFRAILNKELGIESEKDRLENVIQGYVNEEKT